LSKKGVREEEEESSDDSRSTGGGQAETAEEAAQDANGTQSAIRLVFENLRRKHALEKEPAPAPFDNALDLLHDRAALSEARERLRSQDKNHKTLDVIFQARIAAMIGVLNLFLDAGLPYTWREASMVVAKAQGNGPTRARSIRTWLIDFVREGMLPFHSYGYTRKTVLEEGDVLQEIQGQLDGKAKGGFIKAEDVCDIVASERMQILFARLGVHKPNISKVTAQRWLSQMKWRYAEKKNGMYIDGHERDDVVAYRHAFVHRWVDYEARFPFPDANGNASPCASDSRPLVLITHDESIFFQNDERTTCWSHQDSRPTPKPKGDGQSLMVSDFLTAEWGRLRDSERCAFFFSITLSIDLLAERLASCSNLARTATDISNRRNSSPKSIARSKSLRARQTVPRASSCSTTHPVT
jgi:hypothetical protein